MIDGFEVLADVPDVGKFERSLFDLLDGIANRGLVGDIDHALEVFVENGAKQQNRLFVENSLPSGGSRDCGNCQ